MALIQGLTRDRDGYLGIWDEATQILNTLADNQLEFTVRKRLLHTLKGTSAMFGLGVIAKLCHAAEDELFNTGAVTTATDQPLRGRWLILKQMLDTMLGDRDEVEIPSATSMRSGAKSAAAPRPPSCWPAWLPCVGSPPSVRSGASAGTLKSSRSS